MVTSAKPQAEATDVTALLDSMECMIRVHGLYYGEPLHYEFVSSNTLTLMVRFNRMEWLPGYTGERARFVGER